MRSFFSALLFLAGFSFATSLQVPYTSGKLTGSVEISTYPGGQFELDPDTVKIGGLIVRLYNGAQSAPAVCGYKPYTVVQFIGGFGSVWQTADTSADWNSFANYPSSGLVAVDTVRAWENTSTSAIARNAPGFGLFQFGETNTCTGAEYSLERNWNRVVFVRFGSGVDYRAKVSFQAHRDTSYGFLPHYQVLRSITLYYVLNANSTDVSGPVALRPSRPGRTRSGYGLQVEYDLFNPLGIKVKSANPYEAVLPRPVRRKETARQP